jgi:hypothetical protein
MPYPVPWRLAKGGLGTLRILSPTPDFLSCKNHDELRFLYEDHEEFCAFPTFPLVLPFKGTAHDVVPFPSPTLFSFPPGDVWALSSKGSQHQADRRIAVQAYPW